LLVIGGLNWGLLGIGNFLTLDYDLDVVHILLGDIPTAANIVYILVGISALVFVFGCKCSVCSGSDTTTV
jgi:uncharacterized membrane protein YuzA (DUF378 family)